MNNEQLPENDMHADKMQGHWVMARLGKKVLRPGGMNLTKKMMKALAVSSNDSVIEFAPGMGTTAKMTLDKQPAKYVAVDREGAIHGRMKKLLNNSNHTCIQGMAQKSGLPSESATKVYSEAILTMHSDSQKSAIIEEAHRLLKPGGLYAIHEVGINDSISSDEVIKGIHNDLTQSIKVGARPLPNKLWKKILEDGGFEVIQEHQTPFHLLEPYRIIADEGVFGAMKFFRNVMRFPQERKVLLNMKKMFHKHNDKLCAISLIVRKK